MSKTTKLPRYVTRAECQKLINHAINRLITQMLAEPVPETPAVAIVLPPSHEPCGVAKPSVTVPTDSEVPE